MNLEPEDNPDAVHLLELLVSAVLEMADGASVHAAQAPTCAPPDNLTEGIISAIEGDELADSCSLLDLLCEGALAQDGTAIFGTGWLAPPADLNLIIHEGLFMNLGKKVMGDDPTEAFDINQEPMKTPPSTLPALDSFLQVSVAESSKTALMWQYVHGIGPDVVQVVICDAYVAVLKEADLHTDLSNLMPALRGRLIRGLLQACELTRKRSSPTDYVHESEKWYGEINNLYLVSSSNRRLLGQLRDLAPIERDVLLLEIDGFAAVQIAEILELAPAEVSGLSVKAKRRLISRLDSILKEELAL